MSIPKLTIATIPAIIIAVVCIGLTGYLIGSYGLIKSDHAAEILDAMTIDIRPKALSVVKLEQLVNNERQKVGLSTLTDNQTLDASACAKLDDMVAKSYWSHISPDGTSPSHWFAEAGYNYRNAGENLAYGQISEDQTLQDWVASSSHKENMLGDYTDQGVCTKSVKFQNKYVNLTVNHFATPF